MQAAQADCEETMNDSATQRTTDSKAMVEKESAKADTEVFLQDHSQARADNVKMLMVTDP